MKTIRDSQGHPSRKGTTAERAALRKRLPLSRRHRVILGFSLFALVYSAWMASMAQAESLYPIKKATQSTSGSSTSAANLYSDVRARNIGDILFVVIAEATTATSSASTKTQQDDSVNLNGGAGLLRRLFGDLTLNSSNSRAGSGSGTTTRSGSLVTSLAVLVKEILPNGTMRIEGRRDVGINRETQKVVFSGLVRPEDISSDNTISSTLVADAQVRYDGKGIVGETQRPGILSRIFRFLF